MVEKHFPAPDRSRILRLLGLSPPRKDKKSKKSDDDDDEAGGSSSKRKPGKNFFESVCNWSSHLNQIAIKFYVFSVRRAAQRASKRVKVESSDSGSDNESGSDAEFQLSADESPISESNSEASDASSDFNPFYDSDSDAGKNTKICSHSYFVLTFCLECFNWCDLNPHSILLFVRSLGWWTR